MMIKTKKLDAMPYAQAHIEFYDDDSIVLVSYTTPVVEIDGNGWLVCGGLYSRTTIKHISAFMREIVKYPNGKQGSYYDAKNAFLEHYRYNIKTGEIQDL